MGKPGEERKLKLEREGVLDCTLDQKGVVISNVMNVHWSKPNVTSHVQRMYLKLK
jgi:hypothetical protein